jgi:hypothetical protein
VLGNREVFRRVGRHEDDAPAGVEMAVSLASDEELTSRVERKDTVELFLRSHVSIQVPETELYT